MYHKQKILSNIFLIISIYIIGGYDREYGNDENEVIIREAEIVGIIE